MFQDITRKRVGIQVGSKHIMKIKRSIFKRKSGKSEGKWIARLVYVDSIGKTKQVERICETKRAAGDLCDRMSVELSKSHGSVQTGDKMTFNDLADYCAKHFYKSATYAEGRLIEGVRSITTATAQLKVLREYFGRLSLRSIGHLTLRDYRSNRLATVSKHTGRKISVATANRELAMMRRMINIALREGWIVRDPFSGDRSLINLTAEKKRERILSRNEEERLLSACTSDIRAHIRPLIILALDTSLRRGELFRLRWEDIDFENRTIKIDATHTKTQREKIVPLTPRAEAELNRIRPFAQDTRVFPFTDVKHSFNAATKEAGLDGVRFHDLRHTAITRLVRGGFSIGEAGKIAGHTQAQTTYRYINTDADSFSRASQILENYTDNVSAAPRDSDEQDFENSMIN